MSDETNLTVPSSSVDHGCIPRPGFPKPCYAVGIALLVYLFIASCAILVIHLDALSFLTSWDFSATLNMRGLWNARCNGSGHGNTIGRSLRRAPQRPPATGRRTTGRSAGFITTALGRCWVASWRLLVYTLSFVGIQILVSGKQIEISSEGKGIFFLRSRLIRVCRYPRAGRTEAIARKVFRARNDSMNTEQ